MDIPLTQRDSAVILVVDDDKFMRIQLRHAMQQVGYQVVEASDGEEALAAYTHIQPDIVLLDALMPVMDGFTCCKLLRTLPGGEHTPVLMITALEDRESVDLAFEVGAIDYITKPIHWAVLRQRVRRLLEASRSMMELEQQTERAQVARADSEAARSAAEAARHRIANILESITDAFFTVDKDWRFTYINQQAEKFLQRTREELLGKILWDEFPDAVSLGFFDQYHQAISEQVSVEFEEFLPSLSKWFNVHAYPTKDGLSVYFQDITERKQVQEELQRQTMRSQLFSEVTLKIRQSLQIGEILQTTVTEIQRIFQTDRVLIFQLGLNGFGNIVTEAVNPNWPSVLGRNINEDYFESEYLHRYSQGRVYTIADIEKAEIPDCLIEFMQEFNVKAKLAVPIFLKEKLWGLMVAHQCGHPRQWSSFETELMGQLAVQIGIALAQAQLLEQETRQREELARSNTELQQFASIASHDLQEPLRKIQAFSNRLKDKYGEVLTEQGRDYLERMQNAAQRMQSLIDDLLTLSRVTTKAQPFVPVNLDQVTQEVLSDLEVCIQQNRGHVDVGNLPTIDADPIQMRQLLQNLISNALKFHRDDEPQVVKIYSQWLEKQENPPRGGSPVPKRCQIIVEDNGIGFDEKYLDRIFNVFQRLHSRSEFEGTGMGLAICRKIAERHGGSITAESSPGQGAKFIVTLPIQQRTGENTA